MLVDCQELEKELDDVLGDFCQSQDRADFLDFARESGMLFYLAGWMRHWRNERRGGGAHS